MRRAGRAFFWAILVFAETALFAQNHVSVPVDHEVYYYLALAEARGLCPPLPAVKPYSRAKIIEAVNGILAAEPGRFGALTGSERLILENIRAEFTKGGPGLDPWKGKYRFGEPEKNGVVFAGEFGVYAESLNSAAWHTGEEELYLGTDSWGTVFFNGDVGQRFSFGVDLSAGLMRAQLNELGSYDTFATQLDEGTYKGRPYKNQQITTFSQPLAFFPYSYQKRWDGFIFGPGSITASSMEKWPQKIAIGPGMLAEISGTALGDMLYLRFGRIKREWGAMSPGGSLTLNAAARPFLGFEANFNPVSWFSFSSLTGVLEYYSAETLSSYSFQNAFSIYQIELNKGNYFHVDFGSSAIWPKRFELGYIFPLLDNFLYQNFIGDHDNMALFFNARGRYPGLGSFWFSFFLDEAEVSSMIKDAFDWDRHMFVYQAGFQLVIPKIPFASLTVSYTKVEPYAYTHTRNYKPWYDSGNDYDSDSPMETAYVNNGVSLGYYLPPNSDELKLRFELRPWVRTSAHWQYQLIRHGADYGPQQVDGSSLVSELDPDGRSEKASLRKSFLKDGAYQWMHIIKFGVEHKFTALPVSIFGEAGLAYSYFTEIDDDEYKTYRPAPQKPRDPAAGTYSSSTAYILTIGFKVFK